MKIKHLLLIGLIPVLFFVFSCSMFSTMSAKDLADIQSDTEMLQAMLPGLEASLAVYKTPAGTKTFAPSSTNGYPDKTPAEYYTSYLAGDFARYPESGYLSDFYGTQGNQAYLELRKTTDGWGDYEVTLYIFPTLSPSVRYTVEKYRVASDSWSLVDKNGTPDAVAFDSIQTLYFDGRTENRTVKWTRYVDEKIYPASDFTIPADPADLEDPGSLTFDTVSEPAKTPAVSGDGQYSSFTESSIAASTDSGDITTQAKEFYSELSDGKKYAKSYVFDDLTKSGIDTTLKTVRVYSEDSDGNKTIRSKTAGTFSSGSLSWTTTTTEKTDITVNADNTVSYDSTVKKTSSDVTTTTVISLKETSADSNSFTGTEKITLGGKDYNYTVTLDPASGLTITDGKGTDVTFLVNSMQTNPIIDIILSRRGEFRGRFIGRFLIGSYTKNSKRAELILSRMFFRLSSGSNRLLK
ncbi:MAG: hypothetical protein GXP33_05935 [Spirochaetes bacterium]|nr:hypothetical protein [Spirochaetota bacterium]